MQVSKLRQRILKTVEEAAAAGDEGTAAVVSAYARATLVALAQYSENSDIALQDLTVGTETAALILGLHPRYVGYLIRRGHLRSKKEDGEFRIALSDIAGFTMTGMTPLSREAEISSYMEDLLTGAKSSFIIWQSPDEGAESVE